ncbi:MAG: hypothetical protein Q9191_003131 [Dirinaria sp. TL-2023a]
MAAFALNPAHYCRSCLLRLSPPLQRRSFTNTPSRRKHGNLPKFTPTSSPDLDSLLSTFRNNIFLPSRLVKEQKKLIYSPKNRRMLLKSDEPVSVLIGDEVLDLQPLNRLRDEPKTRASVAKVLALMKEGRDWVNLPGFLEGLKTARRKLRGWQVEKMVRRANECGRQGVVLECLRRVEGTAVGLWEVAVVRECMIGAVLKAQMDGWGSKGVEEGANFAMQVWDMLWDERHRVARPPEKDPKLRPEIVGVVVEMLAAKAVKVEDGKGDSKELKKHVERLVGVWKYADLEVDEGGLYDANAKLMMWAPVWHGMKLARTVLGHDSQLGGELGKRIQKDLDPLLKKAKEVVAANVPEGGERRGLKMYEQLLSAGLS